MKKKIRTVLFKIRGSKVAHFLVPLRWVPLHSFIFNKFFNKSNLDSKDDNTFKYFDSTFETESFVQ